MGTALLANGRDEGETLQLRLKGGGPAGTILTEVSASMHCRGFVGEASAEAPTVPELVGVGAGATLRVARTHPFWKSPYTGTVQIKSGEIAEDIVQYLAVSEQTPASMGLSVEWDSELGQVKHAEGWLVTLLPGWDDVSVTVVENNIASFSRMETPEGKRRPEAICEHLMRELDGTFQLEEPVRWRCSCSEKRLLTAVMMLGKEEVGKILREKETVEAKCEWCGLLRTVGTDAIIAHIEQGEGKEELRTCASSPRGLKLDEDPSALQEAPTSGTASWT